MYLKDFEKVSVLIYYTCYHTCLAQNSPVESSTGDIVTIDQ